jgi:hypothetical protein
VRVVLGAPASASSGGQIDKLNTLSELPAWWRYYSWPPWFNQMNGTGRITWRVVIEPGQSVDLTYAWSYYWR